MKTRLFLLVLTAVYSALILAALWAGCWAASAHHNEGGILPGVPNTPAIRQMFTAGELVHCLNPAADSFPGFRAQIEEVNAAANSRIHVRFRVLPGSYDSATSAAVAGCHVWHNGRSDNFCSGCAANVLYANAPVTINYKLSLGYVGWYSTIGHEMGHVYGMHEGYNDVKFVSHILTYGRWAPPWNDRTVMDFGTQTIEPPWGVWALTEADYRVSTVWLYPNAMRAGRDRLPDGRRYVWYCGRDVQKTTSIALLVQWSGGLWWLNIYTETFTSAQCPDGTQGGSFFLPDSIQDGWGLVVRQGNKISWESGKGDAVVP